LGKTPLNPGDFLFQLLLLCWVERASGIRDHRSKTR
jgi:hypothetical protein